MGVTLVNTAEDYPEDLEAGLKTSIIALGLPRGMALASLCAFLGCVGTIGVLVYLLANATALNIWWLSLLSPLAAGTFVCLGIGNLAGQVRQRPLPVAARLVKTRAKQVPLWFTLNAWAVCVAAYCIFLANRV
jgi:4-hydroxybenzoate polyprenyltransferase